MPPRRILVTGAEGFVGGWLLPALAQALPEVELIGTSRAGEAGYHALDITDAHAAARTVREVRPEAVIHLAGIASVADAAAEPDLAWRVNLHGTLDLARAVLAHAPTARFIHVGTSDSYGLTLARWPGPVDEDAPLAPANVYAASKAAADLAVGQLAASDGLTAVRFRPFNHSGPGQDRRFVLPAFAEQVARIARGEAEPVVRVGDLSARRELLDVRDVVAAYVLAATRPEPLPPGTILNLARGEPIAIRSLLDRLIALSGRDIAVEIDPARLRPAERGYSGGDAGRAGDLLGWRPRFTVDQTVEDVFRDLLAGRD